MEWQEEVERGHLEVMKQRRWMDSHSLHPFLVSSRQLLSAWRQHTHLQLCVRSLSPSPPLPLSLSLFLFCMILPAFHGMCFRDLLYRTISFVFYHKEEACVDTLFVFQDKT